MIFSSYAFLLAFLPICLGGYFLLGNWKSSTPARWWLVACSLVFLAWGTGWFVAVFLGSVSFNYMIGTLLGKISDRGLLARRLMLTIGIVGNVALLGYYKYSDFLISNFNALLGANWTLLHIVLPLGISFITFQKIAYLVDSYRGQTVGYRVLDYLLFVSFFPQLIVGPIVHHKEVVPQFQNRDIAKLDWGNLSIGVFLFTVGMAKKLFLADPLTNAASAPLADPASLTFQTAWLHAFSYTLSYYFDLSGYADMAIGLAKIFNINLPQNFDSPYKARNFADYWRRWHITLSRFLNDYVFRSVFKKGSGSFNFYFAVFVTFLVSGFWHGAGWNFVLWGALNGAFVMMAHAMARANKSLPFWAAWGLTILGVVLLRVLFVADSIPQAWSVYEKMLQPTFQGWSLFVKQNFFEGLILAVSMAIVWFGPQTRRLLDLIPRNLWMGIGCAAVWAFGFLCMNKVAPFLYFQF